MKNLTLFSLLLFAALTPSVLWAKHIVGGEITYKFKERNGSRNVYEFTLDVFRDELGGGAAFDIEAAIGVYGKGSGRLYFEKKVSKTSESPVTNPNPPCLEPPEVSVSKASYIWTMELERDIESYLIMYQRCCRNNTITNIVDPGQVGATYLVEITPASMNLNNNSPTFKYFPPTIICASSSLKFDHSAVDTEGDRLEYSFGLPTTGGGTDGQNRTQPNGCNTPAPIPPCWPLSSEIQYKLPYSFSNPMGGNPVIQINPTTGIITGTPDVQGKFVVSVFLKEYRNNVLLTVVQRDFQFNVAPCQPLVAGKIEAEFSTGYYRLKSCDDRTIQVTNQSKDRKNITDWNFDINFTKDSVVRFKAWEPIIVFPDTGVFYGKLVLNPNLDCSDSIKLQFKVFYTVKSDFTFSYDTCKSGPVKFTDVSKSNNGRITSWKWNLNGEKDTIAQNLSYEFPTPGVKRILLSILDEKGCKRDTFKDLTLYPASQIGVKSDRIACTPAEIQFTNISTPFDSTYKMTWDFGDGKIINSFNPKRLYSTPGDYGFKVKIISPLGCETNKSYNNFIKIKQGATANFSFNPDRLTSLNNTATFKDESLFANRWNWYFTGRTTRAYSQKQNPIQIFKDTGSQKIQLVVSNEFGCVDSITKLIDVEPIVTYWLPNAFTPNEDGTNDTYKGVGFVAGLNEFKMQIWNRWGELIFETNNQYEGWNGQKYNKGEQSPQGVYLCVVTFTEPRGKRTELRSYSTLIR